MKGQRKTILVAEDHQSNRKLLALFLEHAHYDVHVAADGFEAVDKMLKGLFDAVITDWDMPRLNGSEFLALSHVHWPDTPVIVVSAHAINPDEGIQQRAFAWLQKPYEFQELLESIHTAVQTSARRRGKQPLPVPGEG